MIATASNSEQKPYSAEFFDNLDRQTRTSAEVIVPMVIDLLRPMSIVDVGCGRGVWLSVFQQLGAERILGLDGPWVDRDLLAIPADCFRCTKLDETWTIGERFDLAICLEVGEHLPKEMSGDLVDRLTSAANVVLFSAALPGQEGTSHINEQWPEYWEELFGRHGFLRLDPFRREVWQDQRVAWYYQQNLFVFASSERIEASRHLSAERDRASNCALTLVHSKILRPLKQARPAVRLLPRLLLDAVDRRVRQLFDRLSRSP